MYSAASAEEKIVWKERMNFNKELPPQKAIQAVKWECENNKFIFFSS